LICTANGLRLLVIRKSWHFLGWNSICQSCSHWNKLSISSWSDCMSLPSKRISAGISTSTTQPQGWSVRLCCMCVFLIPYMVSLPRK
jgi:hypothetical protein